MSGPTVNGSATAEMTTVPGGATLKMNLRLGPSAVVDVLRLWPSFINADARAWCIQNIHGGQLVSASMKIDWDAAAFDLAAHKRAVPADSVLGEMTARDVVVDLLPGLPPLTVAEASGRITGRQFSASAKTGVVELTPTRRIQATDIVYQVPDTSPAEVVPAKASAHLQGGADALVDLLGRDALKHYAGFTLDPALVKGQFEGDLGIDLKLGKSVRPEDQQFHAKGTLANLRVDKFLANERLEQGALTVDANQGATKITGQGQIYGVPVTIDATKGATDEGAITLALVLDGPARAKLGVPITAMLSGPTPVRLKAPLSKSGADIEIDLTRASIDSAQTGPLKPAGKPGKATFSLKPDPDGNGGVAVSSIVVEAGGVAARGSAQFAADGALLSGKLTQVRLSAGDELRVDLIDSPSALKATVRGVTFDARALIKGFLGAGGPPGAGKDIDVDFKVATVIGANSQPLKDLEMSGVWRGSMRSMQAKARIGEGTLSAQQDDQGVLRAHVTDAGALARFLDIYARMEGGALDLTLQQNAEGGEGAANIANFVLRGEPALRQLAAAGQARGRTRRLRRTDARFERGAVRQNVGVVHANARAAGVARGADLQPQCRSDDRRLSRLRPRPRRPQRHVCAGLPGQQPGHPYSGVWTAARRRTERGAVRRQLPHRRPGERSDAVRQSAVGDDAGVSAQGVRRGRRHDPGGRSSARHGRAEPRRAGDPLARLALVSQRMPQRRTCGRLARIVSSGLIGDA